MPFAEVLVDIYLLKTSVSINYMHLIFCIVNVSYVNKRYVNDLS